MSYLILAQSKVAASALGARLELLGENPVIDPKTDSRCVVVEQTTHDGDQGVGAFETVEVRITTALVESFPQPLTVLVDCVRPRDLNPLSDGGGWDSMLAMLVLAVPEARWIFGVISGADPWDGWHSLSALLAKPWRDPLLDPTGLRNVVRGNADAKRARGIPTRTQRAAAIDEEIHYAIFHAYTAYRFGYRADAVTSWKLMEKLFDGESGHHGFQLLLEDVNLNFPDRPEGKLLSDFASDRAANCRKLGYQNPSLETSDFRIIVTTGHSGGKESKEENNKWYLKNHKQGRWAFVLKPTGGMFDLWSSALLFERLLPGLCRVPNVHREGLAPGFVWPPDKKVDNEIVSSGPHSAPGKLMLVANHLVRRADALRENANTVEECIRGALLATDALELLGYRTPTLALQALELKLWFEAKAEVAFAGVGHHFKLKRRFKEVERETKAASRFHHPKTRKASALNSAVGIANRLVLVFRDAGQFDEEEKCLRKLRWWNRKLSFHTTRNPLHWPGLALLAYAEWLISSLGWLLFSVMGWQLVLALGWWGWTINGHSWDDAVKGTLEAFIGSGITNDQGPGIVFLSSFSAMLGFFHLGVFVSYLYSAITRK